MVMPQEYTQPPGEAKKFKVQMEMPAEGIAAAISAINPGQCIITDAWVEVNGSRVTEVAPGTNFKIRATYIAQDLALSPTNRTLMCITAKDSTGQIKNYEDTLLEWGGIGSSGTVSLDKLGNNIMPEQDISIALNMWFNDDSNISPPYPPQTSW